MSRRRHAKKREVRPDSKYNNILATRFINGIMRQGKRSVAEKIFYDAIDIAGNATEKDGLAIFKKALTNVKPSVEVKSRRIGGANYQIPMEVPPDRRITLGIRWIMESTKSRREKSLAQKLGQEFVAAANSEGGAIKKKEDTHRMAEANKAFAHFRWR
jgi:small subunit ribosomal protein S7